MIKNWPLFLTFVLYEGTAMVYFQNGKFLLGIAFIFWGLANLAMSLYV